MITHNNWFLELAISGLKIHLIYIYRLSRLDAQSLLPYFRAIKDMCLKVKIRCFGCLSNCNFVRIYTHVLFMECTLYALANHRAKPQSAVTKCVQL